MEIMQMETKPAEASPLDRPADPGMVRELFRVGLIDARARDAGLDRLLPPRAWWTWADRLLLCLGAALVLAGVIFFFAYNWEKMGKFLKFGLIESGILLCALGGYRWVENLSGKVLVLSAAMLVGPLLAVYGQTYQTGADAYELFAAWALLIIPWTAAARFAGLWIAWLTIADTAVLLYWGQVVDPNDLFRWEIVFLALAAFNGLFLALREAGDRAGREWLAHPWHRLVLLATVLTCLTFPVVYSISDDYDRSSWIVALVLAWALGAAAAGRYYRRVVRDLFGLTLCVASLVVVVLTLIAKILFDASDSAWISLLFGMIILAATGLATLYLRAAGRAMGEGGHD